MQPLMKISLSVFCFFLGLSCDPDKRGDKEPVKVDTVKSEASTTPIVLSYPALYSDWDIGSRENINTVLSVYKDWDELSVDHMKNQFADSVVMDMPAGKRVTSSRDGIVDVLVKFRNNYAKTSNQVISVYPLLNKETNDEWVSALVYNKWTYKDNSRDSMIYQDLWRLKDGKIEYLLSLEQTPSRVVAKRLEKLSEQIK